MDFSSVLDFWFGAADSAERGRARKCWFTKDAGFDAQIRCHFLGLHEAACRGDLAAWERGALSALSLVVTLDQFSRNLFRGTARAFAGDPLAMRVARSMIADGFDSRLRPVERWFVFARFGRFPHRNDVLGRVSTAEEVEFLRQPGSSF
ncbi:MAG: DUF924 domain-containing protein [Betaproteobacteria bacterium]|nr:DUF924 domain-containing protein [Betaproteobacteria bacterium]